MARCLSRPAFRRASWEGGTPLLDLPDDERVAEQIVKHFLAHGADLAFERKDGITAEQLARGRGLTAAAGLVEVRQRASLITSSLTFWTSIT